MKERSHRYLDKTVRDKVKQKKSNKAALVMSIIAIVLSFLTLIFTIITVI